MNRKRTNPYLLTNLLGAVFNGEGEGGGGGEGGEGAPKGPQGGSNGGSDKGFPDGTPLEQMNAAQREAYWKHHARKHEERAKAFDGLTPEDLASLREKASRHDELEHELMSDKDKAVVEAKREAEAAARSAFLPQLVQAEFRAAAAGKIDGEKLAQILEPLDLSKFTKGDRVDADKVAAYVAALPGSSTTPRTGPTSFGLGSRPPASGTPGDQGRAMAAKRFGKN